MEFHWCWMTETLTQRYSIYIPATVSPSTSNNSSDQLITAKHGACKRIQKHSQFVYLMVPWPEYLPESSAVLSITSECLVNYSCLLCKLLVSLIWKVGPWGSWLYVYLWELWVSVDIPSELNSYGIAKVHHYTTPHKAQIGRAHVWTQSR